ncbi:cryptochrome/photolyase family protein [Natronomonas marina]|uniref:cryptochrome/photolyase family protein n=1 Tax=Natronomonas marina TaxID=2961939 RepID=UPI0020C9C802|nr:cryptochrome/photolyase family protein [Natronomonas marina]
MTVWVLGDQLSREHGPLSRTDDGERVLLIEATAFARRRPYHPHKLTLVFSAMRHFRDELRAAGRTVEYHRCETFAEGLDAHFETHPGDELTVMHPPGHGAVDRLTELVEARGGSLSVIDDELFVTTPDQWEAWMGDRDPPYRQETFYREARRATGYLMDGEEPLGGEWNYDDENRQFPGADYDPPEPPRYEPDALTQQTREWVHETFAGDYDDDPPGVGWADPEPFGWPVTREAAVDALDRFVDERLVEFGPYQDAMLADEPAMNHALLSGAMNLGLLHPREVLETVLEAAKSDPDVPLNSVEGFVRQVLGWREFTRHVYREAMPELADANQLDQTEALPAFYWTGDVDAACLSDVVDGVRKRGYSHHIERLMILANFALIYGVEPRQLNEWFHAAYVDAYHWVTTPNVVEMGSYGAGVFATKPYAASANYVDRMSDYCSGCPYAKTKTTGEDACPFNALYWDFLDRNAEELRSNHRMGLVYSHLDDKDDEELAAIRERAEAVRAMARRGEL